MKYLALFFVSLISQFVWGQSSSPYKLHKTTESSIAAYSAIGAGAFLYLKTKTVALTPTQIAELNAQNINAFDRPTTRKYSDKIAKTSDFLVPVSCLLSVGLPGIILMQTSQNKQEFWNNTSTLAVMCLETNLVSVITNNIVKHSVLRTRPYTYNSDVPMEKKLKTDARQSFYSGHTTFVASNCFFAAQVVSAYYPHTWKSYSTWGVAALLPAVVGYMRVESGRHFPTDVITGYALGALCGIAVPYLHTSKKQDVSMTVSPQIISLKIGI